MRRVLAGVATAVSAALLMTLQIGCGGAKTGSFVDQDGYQIGTPPGPAPTQVTRDRVQDIVHAVVPAGAVSPAQISFSFTDGYAVETVWKPGVIGSSGRITGPDAGLPAVFEVSAAGTAIQFTDFSYLYVGR